MNISPAPTHGIIQISSQSFFFSNNGISYSGPVGRMPYEDIIFHSLCQRNKNIYTEKHKYISPVAIWYFLPSKLASSFLRVAFDWKTLMK